MELEAFVTTPEIEDVDEIELQDPGTYQIISWGPGPISWRRRQVNSPYVHGSTLVAAVKESPVIPLSILVEGASDADLADNLAALLRAFEQFRYRLNITVDGEEWEWYCQPADYQTNSDATMRADHWRGLIQVVNFRIPRDPTPVEGTH